MAKKTPQNRYGIKLNDIFVEHWTSEDDDNYHFYQVVALRGETTVVVRKTCKKTVAFDGRYESVAPIPDDWVTDEEFVRRVQKSERDDEPYIKITDSWKSYCRLIKEKKLYLEWSCGPDYPYKLHKYASELAEQLDLKNGSGIFLVENLERGLMNYNQRALIRYPDGKEEETTLKELFNKNK